MVLVLAFDERFVSKAVDVHFQGFGKAHMAD
jgi:hypothetical protein